MRPRGTLIFIGCVLIAATWFVVRSVREEQRKWVTMKGGMQMRVLAATAGGTQQVEVPGPPFFEQVRQAWQRRSFEPFKTGGSKLTTTSGGTTKIAVWAEFRGLPAGNTNTLHTQLMQVRDFEIPLSDGQILVGQPGGSLSWGNGVAVGYLARFELAPRRERELTLTFTLEGERYALQFANPTYQANLPSWNPEPLPKTWRDGDLTVTLENLELKWNDRYYYYGARWALKPKWAITLNGKRADSLFHVGCIVSDTCGNTSPYTGMLSDPAWKLSCQVSRDENYPFAGDEVRWLARFDTAELRKLRGGKHQIYKMEGDFLARGILFAGVLTPGLYELEDGKVISSAPLAPEKPIKSFKAALDVNSRRLRLEVHEIAFVQHAVRHINGDEDEFLVMQYDDGKAIRGGAYRVSGTANEIVTWASLPKRPFRYGLAKQRKFKFEMLVKPPKAPEPPKERSG